MFLPRTQWYEEATLGRFPHDEDDNSKNNNTTAIQQTGDKLRTAVASRYLLEEQLPI